MKRNTRTMWKLIFLVFLSIILGAFFLFNNATQKDKKNTILFTKEEGYFGPLEIHGFSFGNVPYLDVIIGDKTIRSKIDLSYQGMLSLPSDVVEDISEKKWIDRVQVHGMNGRTYERNVYEVKKIKIQKGTFSPVRIEEVSPVNMQERVLLGIPNPGESLFGTIGCELFSRYNLFIDCRHRMIALCDSVETLKKQGYPIDSFTETAMTSNPDCIAFEVLTERGPLCCMVDTGSTLNFLNEDLENGCNGDQTTLGSKDLLIYDLKDIQELSSFKIGGKEFGPLSFHRMKSPLIIDVLLGMEFFFSNLVFIDFENEKIYFYTFEREKVEKPSLGSNP